MDKIKRVQYSLKENCRSRLKGLFEDLQRANKGVSSFLMVTDQNSLKILSSLMKMMELMELNIFSVDLIENERTSYPKQHAIYLLSNSSDSVQMLLDDFKDKKTQLYGKVHLFFLNRVSDEHMKRISSNPILLDKVMTFKEFNQDFTCSFDNIFNLELKQDLKMLYQSKIAEFKQRTQEIGDRLATVVFSFEKLFSVEIMCNKSDNDVSSLIAQAVQSRVNYVLQKLQAEKSEQIDRSAGKITLLIVDRSFDVLTPLVRDFYYQPMLYDLQDQSIQNDIITYKYLDEKANKTVEKKSLLNESDDLFKRYRFQHIGEVMNGIGEEFNKFVSSNSTAKLQMGATEDLDFKKMSEIVRSMPQYQELLSKYNMHMKLIEDCWTIFEKKDLKSIGELEQSCATGLDQAGEKIKEKQIISLISSRLQSDNLEEQDRLRLVLIATLTLELTDKHRKDLTQYLSAEKQRAISNLVYLGVNPQKSGDKKSKAKKIMTKEAQKKAKHRLQNQTFDLCRTSPELETLIETFISDFKQQNFFKIPPNFKSFRINCEDGNSSSGNVKSLQPKNRLANILSGNNDEEQISNSVQKLIFFVAGGISNTEIRAIRSQVDSKDQDFLTILGGTSFLNPNQYVNSLLEMESSID